MLKPEVVEKLWREVNCVDDSWLSYIHERFARAVETEVRSELQQHVEANAVQLAAVEALCDKREDELNCIEAVLDGFAAELPEEPFVSGFECAGDYVTAVVEGHKAKLAQLQEAHDAWKRNAELADAANRDLQAKMEVQKDTWLAWEAKRKALEQAALELEALKRTISDAKPVMLYHGACVIDCGEHGHHHVEMLKMIPKGTALYTLKEIK